MLFFLQAEDGIRDWRDWSSDVCSSDLLPTAAPRITNMSSKLVANSRSSRQPTGSAPKLRTSIVSTTFQIGRASCRERVYVWVVADPIQNNRHEKRAGSQSVKPSRGRVQ